jgi:DNA-binding response OmpR family regulator
MKHTVLTIEDQADIRRLIRMTLEFKGFEVLEAADGASGVAMARAKRPHLILLDVMMPGDSGLLVSAQLRADPALQAIPVVMLSALGTAADKAAGLEAGARGYLVKPFSPWELLALVSDLVAAAEVGGGPAG